jgi:Transposase and inactivated derivatives
LCGIDGDLFERQYRNHLSGYKDWDQLAHAQDWILYPKNIGSYLGIDEVALSQGELYTVVINKQAKGRRGSIVAIIKGTDASTVCSVLLKMSRKRRFQPREITLDMAPNMELICRTCFPAAKRVIDRFHVQKLAYDAVQEMRIKARWEALDKEAIEIHLAKTKGERYIAPVFENGDSLKQLLARSRYLLFKKESLWTTSQRQRAEILFREYPDIKKAYYLTMQLGLIYHQTKHADVALTKFARWYDLVDKSGFLSFGTIVRTIQTHYLNIVNFFHNRSTNAASESFNAKIKAFRRIFRGVKDKAFFLFRLTKLYA